MAKSGYWTPPWARVDPIDLYALAVRRRRFRHRPESIAKAVRVRKRNRKRKSRAASERRRKERTAALAARGWWQDKNRRAILLAMAPGDWYGQPDIEVLTGICRDRLTITLLRMGKKGYVERARNPEWKRHVYRKGIGIDRQAARDPFYLYRMTEKGEAERRWQQALL